MNDPGTVLILGAGPTGLGAAYQLARQGYDDSWLLIEQGSQPGGLASSFVDESGFVWDIGGHVQFSHYAEYDELLQSLLGSERVWHTRKAFVRLGKRFISYPLQHNIHRLDSADRTKVMAGLEESRRSASDSRDLDFATWIDQTFGVGFGALFMTPYNEKVWGYRLKDLSATWIDGRVALPDLEQLRTAIATGEDQDTWGGNHRFSYPLRGGTGETWRRLAARFGERSMFGSPVVGISLHDQTLRLATGEKLRWDTLVTTIPLDLFCGLCEDIDEETLSASRHLLHSSCHIVGIGLRGTTPAQLAGTSWIYFPEASSSYYRVTVLSNYSPHNAPQGTWSLLAEVGETTERPLTTTELSRRVIQDLRNDGLISSGDQICSVWRHHAEYGYPTPTRLRDEVLQRVIPTLESFRVYSRGRFGGWKYEVSNQDHCFMQGMEAVNRILGLGEETTYRLDR